MNPISLIGAFVMTLALLSFGIGSISIQRFKMVSPSVLWFLSAGLILNVITAILMTTGAGNNLLSIHGILGYSSLLFMLIEAILIWRLYFIKKLYAEIGAKLRAYSRVAISWWIIAYITGTLLVIV